MKIFKNAKMMKTVGLLLPLALFCWGVRDDRTQDEASRSQSSKLTMFEMVKIPGGTFMMGSDSSEAQKDEKPVHQVTVDGFSIGKYEVTQAEWKYIMFSNPSHFKGDRLPVENVSYGNVINFCMKLNERFGKSPGKGGYWLPTEAEWEYACRGGTTEDRYGPIDSIAWYKKNSGKRTHEVGGKTPNGYGLYDMLGNVWEWCFGGARRYPKEAETNPIGPFDGYNIFRYKIIRGGGYWGLAADERCSNRGIINSEFFWNRHVGFRIVLKE